MPLVVCQYLLLFKILLECFKTSCFSQLSVLVMMTVMYGRICLRFYFLNLIHIRTSTPQKADVAISNAIKHQMANCPSPTISIWLQVRTYVVLCLRFLFLEEVSVRSIRNGHTSLISLAIRQHGIALPVNFTCYVGT